MIVNIVRRTFRAPSGTRYIAELFRNGRPLRPGHKNGGCWLVEHGEHHHRPGDLDRDIQGLLAMASEQFGEPVTVE